MTISGLFANNNKHYGVQVNGVQNPTTSGPSTTITLEVINSAGQGIASRSTNSRVTVLEPLPQAKCNKVCGSCAGTNSTCTSCNVPSKYPIFRDYQCVDTCGKGFYFDRPNLQCIQCHHSCSECFGPGNNQC